MASLDLLILTIYIISVVYVLYQAINSLEDRFVFEFDRKALEETLQEQKLQDLINIQFKFSDRYQRNELRELALSLENKSQQYSIYVDWDHSSLSDLGGRSRRVIRTSPSPPVDLSQSQVFNIVAPGQTLRETLTAENTLKRDSESKAWSVTNPLIDVASLEKGSVKDKQRYADFMAMVHPLSFSLRLSLRFFDPVTGAAGSRFYIPCHFTLTKLPWTDALPGQGPAKR